MFSKGHKAFLFFCTFVLTGIAGYWIIKNTLPTKGQVFTPVFSQFPKPKLLTPDSSDHALSIQHYRQIGKEIHLLVYSQSENIAPFDAILSQFNQHRSKIVAVKEPGSWLRLATENLTSGPVQVELISQQDSLCRVKFELEYKAELAEEIADTAFWFRQGSYDEWLDIRVVQKNGHFFLKDFANYNDGRSKTYFVEGMITQGLEKGIKVLPGYTYTVVAKWVEKNYGQWWQRSNYRTSRLQSIYIHADTSNISSSTNASLTKIDFPSWFQPSTGFNPHFDKIFPEFEAPEGKLILMYRLNEDVPATNYLKRGITHLPRWEHTIPSEQQHWTEAPGFFEDKGEEWFSQLTKEEVEAYADRVGKLGVYAFDFEFWNRRYSSPVKQRLIWFARRLKANHPDLHLFDYWGGSAYHNTTFQTEEGYFNPLSFINDYHTPRANHYNFEKAPDGDSFGKYFNITIVDVYPRPQLLTGNAGYNLNNYLVLSAIHASRINRKFDFQKENKTIWYAWNRFMPLYQDPGFPWHVKTTEPAGSLVFTGLETQPASQALAIALFALIEGDGFYLWNDTQPWGKGPNNYRIDPNDPWQGPVEWWPNDGNAKVDTFKINPDSNESPRYWDYPSEYYLLGSWMVSQVKEVLEHGVRHDLPFFHKGVWQEPREEQAVIAAHNNLPFVTSVQNGNQIIVLALDSFQPANQSYLLPIRLPNGSIVEIELYGNWPVLYRGVLD